MEDVFWFLNWVTIAYYSLGIVWTISRGIIMRKLGVCPKSIRPTGFSGAILWPGQWSEDWESIDDHRKKNFPDLKGFGW